MRLINTHYCRILLQTKMPGRKILSLRSDLVRNIVETNYLILKIRIKKLGTTNIPRSKKNVQVRTQWNK